MHTTTSKQVLAPLAEAVSALIVIISEAEINNTPTPELSEIGKVVNTQINNLITVALRIMDNPNSDQELRDKMPNPCNLVKNASVTLSSATDELKNDPFSSKGRAMLLEAIKDILSGTTGILDIYDDSEVRKIIVISNHVCRMVKDFVLDMSDSNLVYFAHLLSQRIVTLTHLCYMRVQELEFEHLQLELKEALNLLKSEALCLVQNCKLFLGNAKSPELDAVWKAYSERVTNVCSVIERLILYKSEADPTVENSEFKKTIIKHKALSQNLKSATIENYDFDVRRKAFQEYQESSKQVLKYYRSMCSSFGNYSMIESIEQAIKIDLDSAKNLYEKPLERTSDETLNNASLHFQRSLTRAFDTMERGYPQVISAELVDILLSLSNRNDNTSIIDSIETAISNNDKPSFNSSMADFRNRIEKLENIVNEQVKFCDINPQLRDRLLRIMNNVKLIFKSTEASLNHLICNPGNIASRENANFTIAALKGEIETAKSIFLYDDTIFTTKDLISGSFHALQNQNIALSDSFNKGDRQLCLDRAKKSVFLAEHFIEIATKEIAREVTESYSIELSAQIQPVRDELAKLNELVSLLEQDPSGFDVIQGAVTGVTSNIQAILTSFPLQRLTDNTSKSEGNIAEMDVVSATKRLGQMTVISEDGHEGSNEKIQEIEQLTHEMPRNASEIDQFQSNTANSAKGEVLNSENIATLVSETEPLETRTSQANYARPSVNDAQFPGDDASAKEAWVSDPLKAQETTKRVVKLSFEQRRRLTNAEKKAQVGDQILITLRDAVSELVISNGEAPQPLTQEEAEEDPVKAGGQLLKIEASNWDAEENPIVEVVLKMSESFFHLSQSHAELKHSSNQMAAEAKKKLIQTAQDIVVQASAFVKHAQLVIEGCTSPRLRSQLETTLNRIQALSQQLKVIVAVKASAPKDKDGAAQLVTSALNLTNSIKTGLRDCVSCSLRNVRRDHEKGMRFRKVVYKKFLDLANINYRLASI